MAWTCHAVEQMRSMARFHAGFGDDAASLGFAAYARGRRCRLAEGGIVSVVAEVELAPDAALAHARGTGLDGVPGVPFLDSVLLLDVGASFLEEAVRR